MTNEKTIEILKAEYLGDSENMKIAKRIAISALEKQIPKKPHEIYEKLNIKWCKCGCYLGELKNEQNYCKKCGQALDWSDCPTEKGR